MITSEAGFVEVQNKIKMLGATNIVEIRDGKKRYLRFTSLNGKQYNVTSRSKKTGTWQTSINYGVAREENTNETDFWAFVDISSNEPVFYIAPLWWVQNDIYEVHSTNLKRHGGQRAENNDSTHHSISKKRISKWLNSWDEIGLNH